MGAGGAKRGQGWKLTDLSGYPQVCLCFFEDRRELPADALIGNLDMHISTLLVPATR